MSEFRVEKRRVRAELTLSGGAAILGCFFLSGSTAAHAGPECVADLLNTEAGFFPFEPVGGTASDTVLVNRAHLIAVKLLEPSDEPQADPGYSVATKRHVVMRLSNGASVSGSVRVYRRQGHDRLSDHARLGGPFRYVECAYGVLVVNSAHVVDLREKPA